MFKYNIVYKSQISFLVHKLILNVVQRQNTKEKLETLASFFIIRRTSIYAAYIINIANMIMHNIL